MNVNRGLPDTWADPLRSVWSPNCQQQHPIGLLWSRNLEMSASKAGAPALSYGWSWWTNFMVTSGLSLAMLSTLMGSCSTKSQAWRTILEDLLPYYLLSFKGEMLRIAPGTSACRGGVGKHWFWKALSFPWVEQVSQSLACPTSLSLHVREVASYSP